MCLSVNQKFEFKLKSVIGESTDLRPFVCDGFPMECEIFIVGYNPATEMSQSFWEFWNSDTGFNKTAWFEAYKRERIDRPLKPGRTRRNLISPTRQRIEWITEFASPIKCLETNIYSKATEKAKDLSIIDQEDEVFKFLLQEIRPKVMLLHGLKTLEHLRKIAHLQTELSRMMVFTKNSVQVKVIAVPHLSRGCSQLKTEEWGKQLREICTQR